MNPSYSFVTRNNLKSPPRHYVGSPLSGEATRFCHPDVLVIEERASGVFLFRVTEAGTVVGDTWHRSQDEARAQAGKEYGGALGEWREISAPDVDPIDYAVEQLKAGT